MSELNFIADLVEERLVKGKFRWLANFKEIRRDYSINGFTFPVYATGGLEEKGFLLSRIFSTFVTPKYKVHFLLHTSSQLDVKLFRQLITSCKSRFGAEDWIFFGLVQGKPFEKTLKDAIEHIADRRIGIAAYSLTSKSTASSKNVLGNALQKQLKLTEAKFEVFDVPNYLKSFAIVFCISMVMLMAITFFVGIPAEMQIPTFLILTVFSLIAGHRVYKTRYHMTLTLNAEGFDLREGKTATNGKWSDFKDLSLYVTPKYETCLRLYSKERTFDLPISRTGISRKDAYNAIRRLIRGK